MELHHWRAQPQRGFDLALVGGDEQADTDPGISQTRHDRGEPVVLTGCVESALGGALFAPFGDDAGGVRFVAQRDRQHLVSRGHL